MPEDALPAEALVVDLGSMFVSPSGEARLGSSSATVLLDGAL